MDAWRLDYTKKCRILGCHSKFCAFKFLRNLHCLLKDDFLIFDLFRSFFLEMRRIWNKGGHVFFQLRILKFEFTTLFYCSPYLSGIFNKIVNFVIEMLIRWAVFVRKLFFFYIWCIFKVNMYNFIIKKCNILIGHWVVLIVVQSGWTSAMVDCWWCQWST